MNKSKQFNPGKFVKDAFIMYLREVFRINADNIGYQGLNNEKDAGIEISEQYGFDRESVGDRPVILVARGDWTFGGESGNMIMDHRVQDNTRKYTSIINVPITVFVGSRNGLEAEQLASIAANMIVMDQRSLAEIEIHSITKPLIGRENTVKELPDMVAIPINFVASIQTHWVAKRIPAERLNSIKQSLLGF
ncbi:MAG: hypothetical protein SVK08_01875 [Halobacteriota archaeon]|nr:hypothetical protein [Halobacteriota archaeon]